MFAVFKDIVDRTITLENLRAFIKHFWADACRSRLLSALTELSVEILDGFKLPQLDDGRCLLRGASCVRISEWSTKNREMTPHRLIPVKPLSYMY
jgi:hypothetical protein